MGLVLLLFALSLINVIAAGYQISKKKYVLSALNIFAAVFSFAIAVVSMLNNQG